MRDNIAKYGFSKLAPAGGSDHPNYISWLEEHPSALGVFKKEIQDEGKGKQIVVFLDYDGTLSPIVDDPNLAFMSNEMRSAVGDVAKFFPTAIISGRSRKKVYEFVKLDEVYYAGSHGMDIKGPAFEFEFEFGSKPASKLNNNLLEAAAIDVNNETSLYQPAREFLPALHKIMEELKTRTSEIVGVFIEDNQFCLSVHYRHVHQDDYEELEKRVYSIVEEYGGRFKVTKGIKVLEIRPSIEWNKGNALMYLLQTLGFSQHENVLPIYIGDDKTDEDAFQALKKIGHGCSVIVSSTPRDTLASCSLRDPSQVQLFLNRLAKWGEKSSNLLL